MNLSGVVRLRASEAGAVFSCPSMLTARTEGSIIDIENEFAEVGSCVHAVAKVIVQQNLPLPPDLDPFLFEFGLTDKRDEIGYLSWQVCQTWAKMKKYFTDSPEVEQQLESFIERDGYTVQLRGRGDVFDVIRGKNTVYVLDWKSGILTDEKAHLPQLMIYGYLAMDAIDWDPEITKVSIILAWVREGETTHKVFPVEAFKPWMDEKLSRVESWPDNKFNPTKRCSYCHRWPCEGREDMAQSGIRMFLPAADGTDIIERQPSGYPANPEQMFKAYMQWKLIKNIGEQWEKQLRIDLKKFGTMEGEFGSIGLVDVKGRMALNARKTIPIIQKNFGVTDEEILDATSLSKKGIMTAIRGHNPEGVSKKDFEQHAEAVLLEATAAKRNPGYSRIITKQA